MSDAAHRMTHITGNTTHRHFAQAGNTWSLDLASNHTGWRVTPFALPGDFMSHCIHSLIEFSLVNWILESEMMNRAGPLLIFLLVTVSADAWWSELSSGLIPFDKRRVVRVKLPVKIEDRRAGQCRAGKYPDDKNRDKIEKKPRFHFHSELLQIDIGLV